MNTIADWFIEKTAWKKSNFCTIIGAIVILLSLALPWFRRVYSMSSETISPAELVAGYCFDDNGVPALLIIAVCYIAIASVLSFFIRKRQSAILAALGIAITAIAVYFSYIPPERFCWGMGVSFLGMALLLSGFIDEQG
jgi:hypothetical protein